jgi:hypothetical protein
VANSPNDLATADFNRDGVPDLIAAGAAKTMSVLLGAGDGSFTAAPTPPSVGGGVSGLEIADLNNDGKTDVVVVNAATSNASILLGAGNGTFSVAPGSPLAVAGGAVEGAVGDLTSDGIPDLVVGQASGQSMTAYAGNGDGSFRALAGTPIGLGSADADVAVGDFDGRNGPDLAAVTQNSKLSVWLQNRARDSVFAIAAPAGYGYEEGDLTVKADGTSTALTYEAGL